MSAAASDSGLALPTMQPATQMGPCLAVGMGEASMVAALNSWGAARDYDMLDLKANLSSTQVGVATAFGQAQEALLTIVRDFRTEAAQSVARLEQVVTEDLTTGRAIKLERRGGIYLLKMFVAHGEAPLLFRRQGA